MNTNIINFANSNGCKLMGNADYPIISLTRFDDIAVYSTAGEPTHYTVSVLYNGRHRHYILDHNVISLADLYFMVRSQSRTDLVEWLEYHDEY